MTAHSYRCDGCNDYIDIADTNNRHDIVAALIPHRDKGCYGDITPQQWNRNITLLDNRQEVR